MLGKKCYVTVIGTAILSMLLSCGGVRQINLTYTSDSVGPFPRADSGQEVIVNKFKDNRSQKHIGEARNYGGTVFFTVEAKNDISSWVTHALATELEKAGFKVTMGENINNPEKFVINGTLSQLSAGGVLSEMRVTVQLTKGYKIMLNNSYSAEGKVSSQNVYLTNYTKLYDVTLQNLARQMIPQIITAINQQRE
jgi:hypothetical protein